MVGLEGGPEKPAGDSNVKKRKGHQSSAEYTPHKRSRPLVPQHMTYRYHWHKLSSLIATLPESADISAFGTVQAIALVAAEMESSITAELREKSNG